jgi:multidrug resistance efflux pump
MPASNNGPLSLRERVRSLRLPNKESRSGARFAWLPWALCALFALAALVLAIRPFDATGQQSAAKPSSTGSASQPSGQNSGGVPPSDVALELKGYIMCVHQITVSPKVGGMILKLNVEEGQRVKKGDILAQLETVEYSSDYQNARGVADASWQRWLELASGNREEEIEQARAELEENEANRDQYYLDWKRSMDLKRGQVLASKDYEQAYSLYKTTERKVERLRLAYKLMTDGARVERLDAAWADVVQAEAALVKARWRLDNCTVPAPITGTILTKTAEEGNIVNPVTFNLKASICDLADLSDLEVEIKVAERNLKSVFKGQKCEVRPEAFPDRVYPGFVSRLMPTGDRNQGALPVRVKIQIRDARGNFTLPDDDEGKFLRPDMGAIVRFLNPSAARAKNQE